jgi:hypothetical protein
MMHRVLLIYSLMRFAANSEPFEGWKRRTPLLFIEEKTLERMVAPRSYDIPFAWRPERPHLQRAACAAVIAGVSLEGGRNATAL